MFPQIAFESISYFKINVVKAQSTLKLLPISLSPRTNYRPAISGTNFLIPKDRGLS